MTKLNFPTLTKGIYIQKRNRFIAEVQLDGAMIDVHLPTTGRLDTVLAHGAICYLKPSTNPNRKTAYSLFLVEVEDGTLVCIDALVANQMTALILQKQLINGVPEGDIKAEVGFDQHRFDFVVHNIVEQDFSVTHIIEVKSVTMAHRGIAMFPDAPTERGQKHIAKLIELQKKEQFQTHIVFVIQRNDAESFAPCVDRDPKFAQLLQQAKDNGTMIHVCFTRVSPKSMELVKESSLLC
ncbi:hypothetical protein BHU72_06925 [Desulfuribacillus stibiiarsenatis]|uniref:Sugar fermentation stimulation protein homolog n=1 Tax=Desulfuribacillus stibiiarsenatis TaxID=1390249 RepID=A0A1E5L459_9FIRM|nr:DNA/RNA nuclease SfsA [Desulfuribacillus stibiiarsenatis]OEH84918.1 hypothetical protein BHU72_06925 [Desulfuribacillus stibiiarsenatis]